MDIIFDIISLPFELIGGSIECLFTCLFLAAASACCIITVLALGIL